LSHALPRELAEVCQDHGHESKFEYLMVSLPTLKEENILILKNTVESFNLTALSSINQFPAGRLMWGSHTL